MHYQEASTDPYSALWETHYPFGLSIYAPTGGSPGGEDPPRPVDKQHYRGTELSPYTYAQARADRRNLPWEYEP